MQLSFMSSFLIATTVLSLVSDTVHGFVPGYSSAAFKLSRHSSTLVGSAEAIDNDATLTTSPDQDQGSVVRAPLKYMGPYPCLALRFPDLATASQKQRNVTGVSLDFVLDTAANTNTIHEQVAKELGLQVVGSALPGLGPGGAISGGATYLLGDSQLDGLPKESDPFTFMTGLTASALPIASPAAAGLLSLPFFNCFEGGVEFTWGAMEDGKITTLPSVTFYGENESDELINTMTCVPITPLAVTLLPSITVEINGVSMPALLDTGSPITVLNHRAAQAAGVEAISIDNKDDSNNNPFAAVANKFKTAQRAAEAAARGDILAIMGSNGQRVELRKSTNKVNVSIDGKVDFGKGNVYVGDLPGLAAMNGLGVDSPPAVVLGTDVLRMRPRMLLRSKVNKVYF